MENKNSEIILNRVLESILLEQTGLVYVGPPSDKKKQDGPGALGFISRWGTIFIWAAGLISTTLIGRFLHRRWKAIKSAGGISKISWKELLSFQRNIGTPKGIAKLKRQCQQDVLNGKMTTEERNKIFSLLDDPQVLQSIREKVFDDVLKKFKRGQMPAEEFIAHLDLKTAREVGPVIRQMEKDGVAGVQGKVGKEIKTNLIPGVTVKLPPVYNAESFNKVINTADKAGILEKIYGKEAVKQWKTKQTGLLNFDIKQLDNLLSFDKPGAFVFKTEVKSLQQYKELLKQYNMSIPADPTDMAKKWKFYQLKQIFAKSKY